MGTRSRRRGTTAGFKRRRRRQVEVGRDGRGACLTMMMMMRSDSDRSAFLLSCTFLPPLRQSFKNGES